VLWELESACGRKLKPVEASQSGGGVLIKAAAEVRATGF
jgi:hypothetical protein